MCGASRWESPSLKWGWIPRLKAIVGQGMNHLQNLPRSSDFSRSRKELYSGLVVGSASYPLVERLGWSAEEVRSHWNWAPGSGFSLNWRLARNVLVVNDWAYRACIADMPAWLRQWFRRNGFARLLLLWAGSPVLEPRRGVDGSHQPYRACTARRWVHFGQCLPFVSGWEACCVSRDPSRG